MPTPPILEIEALAAPILGDNPAGGSVPFAVREKLEDYRKEIDPDSWAPNDPMRPEAPKRADWPAIVKLAQDTLTQTSKDLLVVARLTEGLARDRGFAGLRDGLHLMRVLVDQGWNRLNPPIESEDDLEVRAAPFFWLDDTDRGSRFPTALRAIPIVVGEKGRYGWQHWKEATSGKGKVTTADIDKAIQATPRDQCQAVFDDISQAWEELDKLAQELNTKMGRYAPGFTGLRGALGDCRSLAQQILQRKGPAPVVEDPAAGVAGGEPDGGGGGGEAEAGTGTGKVVVVEKKMATREDVYAKLLEAADLLQQLEPHSPVPYLIHRAIEFGAMSFPDLMKALVLNADVLKVMNRELGIKDDKK